MLKKLLATLLAGFTVAAFAAVDVNKADQAALESVKGIGTSLSTRILEARKQGNFKDWPDLVSRVRGIGGHNAAKFSAEGLTVNDAPYAPAAPTATAAGKTKAASAKH